MNDQLLGVLVGGGLAIAAGLLVELIRGRRELQSRHSSEKRQAYGALLRSADHTGSEPPNTNDRTAIHNAYHGVELIGSSSVLPSARGLYVACLFLRTMTETADREAFGASGLESARVDFFKARAGFLRAARRDLGVGVERGLPAIRFE